jgi:hypothetical protein
VRKTVRHDGCPEAETIAAYVEGVQTPAERSAVEQHLMTCADCREVVGETVAVGRVGSVAPAAGPQRSRWVVAGSGLLAAAAALVLAVQLWPSNSHEPEVSELVQAMGNTRTFEPRLTGGFAHGEPPAVVRGDATNSAPPDVRIAAARIAQRVERDPSDANVHAAALAEATTGDFDGAVTRLRTVTTGDDASASALADLGAVLLARAQRTRNRADGEAALAALDAALARESGRHEALFNRALALEFMASPDAAAAWERYLQADAESAWAGEARARLAALRASPVRSTPK